MPQPAVSPLIGIFVGGRGSRMGGIAKGQLKLRTGETVLARLLAVCDAALPGAAHVLIGDAAAYAAFELPALADTPPNIGPLGGLRALLAEAARAGQSQVLTLACDMPYVGERLVQRLASEAPRASALAPYEDERWYCLSARYAVDTLPDVDAAIAAGEHALQRLFARLGTRATRLELAATERSELKDWDRPEDIDR
jgi:molybdopterin-guanine dinucleotide biosynthesis protein A